MELVTENENTSLKDKDLMEMPYKWNDKNVAANLIRNWIDIMGRNILKQLNV